MLNRKLARLWDLPWVVALVLGVITFIAYESVLRDGFIWDDNSYVTQNHALRSLDGLRRIWSEPRSSPQYYPLVFSSFWVEYHLWGGQPLGYHVVNILLHSLNAFLLWRVLLRLNVPGAVLAALIFALHPVQVESVAWITERKNLLSTAFYLLAMLAYFRFRPLTEDAAIGSRDWRFYLLAIALFLGALLSKTVACSLPAVILLLTWWKKGRIEKPDVVALSPMFAIGAVLGMVTVWLETKHVGASGAEWSLSFVQRCLLSGRALWFYAGKLFWPHEFTFIYARWEIDPRSWWQYLYPLAALAVLTSLWVFRRRIGRGPLVAACAFAITLFPALGFFDIYPFRYSFVADHFQYLASAGLIALVVSGVTTNYERIEQPSRQVGAVVIAVALVILGTTTWRQGRIYLGVETLWRDTLAKNPDCWMAWNNLGSVLFGEGKSGEAIAHYEQALRVNPNVAEAHYNLGTALFQMGRVKDAIGHYEQAIRLKANFAEAHSSLGIALVSQGKSGQAITHYEQALTINPDYAEAHNNLGLALGRLGKSSEAITHYEQALRINPDYAEAHNNLAIALGRLGKTGEAITHYEQALRINPDYAEAHYNLGNALFQTGRVNDAIGHYEQAVRFKPDFAEAHNNLGTGYSQTGKIEDAIRHYEQAIRLRPDSAEAYYNLGLLLLRARRVQEAVGHLEQAVRLKPDFAEAHCSLGNALSQTGNMLEAIEHYNEAVQLNPNYTEALGGLARLRGLQ